MVRRASRTSTVVAAATLTAAALVGCSTDESTDARPTDGGALYLRSCGGCHGAKGTPQQLESLPDIGSLTKDELEVRILHGGEQMPAFAAALGDDDLDAIVGYLTE